MVIPAVFPILVLSISARYLPSGEFGAYLIIMTILGYSGLLELGMSRALIKQFSFEYDNPIETEITFVTGFITMLWLGVTAIVLLLAGINLAGETYSGVPRNIVSGVKFAAFALPSILLSQVFYAYLEGSLRYTYILKIKLICAAIEAIILISVLLWFKDLALFMLAFSFGKGLTLILLFFHCSGMKFIKVGRFSYTKLFHFLRFGGWLTLSSIIGPIMVYFDRFFVSSSLGIAYSEQYLAVSEIIIKIAIIPMAISKVVFVLMSRVSIQVNKESNLGYGMVLVSVVPFLLLLYTFTEPILNLLISDKTTELSILAFRILCVGLFFNAIAQIPYAKLLAAGQSKITALIHLFELFPYLILLYFTISHYGLVGVAIVWALRSFIDCTLMLYCSRRMTSE